MTPGAFVAKWRASELRSRESQDSPHPAGRIWHAHLMDLRCPALRWSRRNAARSRPGTNREHRCSSDGCGPECGPERRPCAPDDGQNGCMDGMRGARCDIRSNATGPACRTPNGPFRSGARLNSAPPVPNARPGRCGGRTARHHPGGDGPGSPVPDRAKWRGSRHRIRSTASPGVRAGLPMAALLPSPLPTPERFPTAAPPSARTRAVPRSRKSCRPHSDAQTAETGQTARM